jgi:hypothetical protein
VNSIPVIGTAVVNSVYWVKRLIDSVDFPVKTFVIINNNGRGELNEELDKLCKVEHEFIDKLVVCHMPSNVGVAGAWNLIIKCYMNSPFWIIVNDDVAFEKGFLKEMFMTAQEDPEIGLIHGFEGDFESGSWDLFLIRDIIIQEFGLFDENLYPAYNEDTDYLMRTLHRPIKKVLNLSKNYYHGEGNKDEYYKHGSQTRKTDPSLNDKLNFANEENIEYLNEKWGKAWRNTVPYEHPFNNKNIPISYTSYNLKFVRKKNLGF